MQVVEVLGTPSEPPAGSVTDRKSESSHDGMDSGDPAIFIPNPRQPDDPEMASNLKAIKINKVFINQELKF